MVCLLSRLFPVLISFASSQTVVFELIQIFPFQLGYFASLLASSFLVFFATSQTNLSFLKITERTISLFPSGSDSLKRYICLKIYINVGIFQLRSLKIWVTILFLSPPERETVKGLEDCLKPYRTAIMDFLNTIPS